MAIPGIIVAVGPDFFPVEGDGNLKSGSGIQIYNIVG